MKGTLISDMENEVLEGIRKTNTEQQGDDKDNPPLIPRGGRKASPRGGLEGVESVAVAHQPSEKEPTKGVQTYIPMSMYRRLNDIKLTRRENIAALVSQAIELWLDVQEGKAKVNKVI